MVRNRIRIGIVIFVAVVGVAIALVIRFSPFGGEIPVAERGRRIADSEGCFTCHGPGGIRGAGNPGHFKRTVPSFEDDLMLLADDADEVREWIRDGAPAKKLSDPEWRRERDEAAMRMPAFGDRLTDKEIDDLVTFVLAMKAWNKPGGGEALRGYERAETLGCFGCHGKGGVFAPPNPGSVKGYIPPWNGKDFPELVRDRDEFTQWVESGISDRFANSAFAKTYLERANIQMPPYKDHLDPGDIDALWAYVQWLREKDESP